MAYTRNWDNAAPAGSSQVSGGDNSIRAMKEDLEERLESFFEDIDADPLTAKAGAIDTLTAVEGKILMIHPAEGKLPTDEGGWTLTDDEIEIGANALRIPITSLPVGCIITNIKMYVNRGLGTQVEVKLKSATVGVIPAAEDHWDETVTDAGNQEVDSGVLAVELADTKAYFLQVNGDSINQFFGARIVYNSPGLSAVR